jgi:ATP synthase subunit 6
MFVDLFSIFDDHCFAVRGIVRLLWAPYFFTFLFVFLWFWGGERRFYSFIVSLWGIVLPVLAPFRSFTFFLVILLFILLQRIMIRIFPGIFPYSAHTVLTLFIVVPIWISMLVSSGFYNIKNFALHLLPEGVPNFLAPFVSLLELFRVLVRGVTLPLRITLNLLSGHLFIRLISIFSANMLIFWEVGSLFFIFLFYNFYAIVEVGVGILQTYILIKLVTVYINEHPRVQ